MKDRAEILRPIIQAALDEGGVEVVVEVVCGISAEFESRITQFETRIAELERRLNQPPFPRPPVWPPALSTAFTQKANS